MTRLLLLLALIQGRFYWPTTVSAIVHGLNKHTHVSVRAKVIRSYRETDGDKHNWIKDITTGDSLVVECIPEIPCPTVLVGKILTFQGITRFDGEHKWQEIHPLERVIP